MKCIFVSFFYTLPFTFRTMVVLFWQYLNIILTMWWKSNVIRHSFAKVEFNPTKFFIFFTDTHSSFLSFFLSHTLFLFISKTLSFHYLSHFISKFHSPPLDVWRAVEMNNKHNIFSLFLIHNSIISLIIFNHFLSHYLSSPASFFHQLRPFTYFFLLHLPLPLSPPLFSMHKKK